MILHVSKLKPGYLFFVYPMRINTWSDKFVFAYHFDGNIENQMNGTVVTMLKFHNEFPRKDDIIVETLEGKTYVFFADSDVKVLSTTTQARR